MEGYSLAHWPWFRLPDATIEDSLIIPGEERKLYYPGEDTTQLLNAVQRVKDKETALEFVKKWGLLGLRWNNITEGSELEHQIVGAVKFALAVQKKQSGKPNSDFIDKEVSRVFYPEGGGEGLCLSPKGDSLADTINFTQWVKHITKIKELLKLYEDDPFAADCEAEEWIFSLPDKWYNKLIRLDIRLLEEQYGPGYNEPGFYDYVLRLALSGARYFFFGFGRTGIRVELFKSPDINAVQGYPIFQFDGLFRLISYALLAHGAASPKKCADPKCGKLFFPTKADQKYCPAPPDKKRSQCEQRHSQEKRRRAKNNS